MALTAQEQAELDALEAQRLTPDEQAELDKLNAMAGSKPYMDQDPGGLKEAALTGVDYLGRGLDYAGGGARTAAAQLAQLFTDKQITKPEDLMMAVKGKAPTTDEYLKRAGVPEGASLSDAFPGMYSQTGEGLPLQKGGALDPTVRGAAGFVGDVALDPLTYLTLGGSGAAKTALNPTAKAIEKAGEKLYKSGFKAADTRLAERGLEPVSGYALEQGMWGGRKSLLEQMEKRKDQLMTARDELYNKLTQKGAKVDLNKAEQKALNNITELSGKGYGSSEKAESLLETLSKRPTPDLPGGGLSLSKASGIKSSLYDMLPPSAFDVNGRLTNDGKKMLQDLSQGYRQEIVGAANRAEPGMGNAVDAINAEFAAYANAKKPIMKDLAVDERKNLITQVKAALGIKEPAMAAMMYTAQGLNSPAFRTGAGLLMNKAGTKGAGYIDPVVRRLIIENQSTQPQVNPWENLK